MANANNVDDARHLQVFKLEGRRNKMDFIRGFPGVAARFGITGMVKFMTECQDQARG